MVEIHWTNEAELWLKNIHDYIALDKSAIAKKVVTEIYQKYKYFNHFQKLAMNMKIVKIKR